MSVGITIAFLSGALLGAGFGVWWQRRQLPGAPFVDPEEVSEAVEASQAAVAERTEKRFDRIMSAARQEGRITNDGVEELFCISDRTASRYLVQLQKEGRLQRHGIGRGTYYVPTDS